MVKTGSQKYAEPVYAIVRGLSMGKCRETTRHGVIKSCRNLGILALGLKCEIGAQDWD